MEVAKQAVYCYCAVTGNSWSRFFDKINEAVESDADTGELWLIKKLCQTIEKSGISLSELKANKDAIKSVFDDDARRKAGEFFTPEIWASEARKYFDKYIPNWQEMNIWDGSCYSDDTLIRIQRRGETKERWVSYDELRDTDKVISLNPETMKEEPVSFVRRIETQATESYIFRVPAVVPKLEVGKNDKIIYDFGVCSWSAEEAFEQTECLWTKEQYNTVRKYAKQGCLTEEVFEEHNIVPPLMVDPDGRGVALLDIYDYFSIENHSYSDYKKYLNFVLVYKEVLNVTADHSVWVHLSTGDYDDFEFDSKLTKMSAKELYEYLDEGNMVVLPAPFTNDDFFEEDDEFPDGYILSKDLVRTEEVAFYSSYWGDYFEEGYFLITDPDEIYDLFVDEETGEPTDYARIKLNSKKKHTKTPQQFWDITLEKNHIFRVSMDNSYSVYCGNCGSGNLLRTANHPADKTFLSTLQEDDVTLLKNTKAFENATVFQCDFLSDLDYDTVNTEFLNKLPVRLQEIIRNDEPLIIFMNPPYKSGSNSTTDIGRYMCEVGLSRAAYDIFYQFVWRLMHFVDLFNLKNTWVGLFGPLQLFTGSSVKPLLQEFERCYEFKDGMCISATEFSDTSTTISWGIGFTLWQSRGGYHKDDFRHDVMLERKICNPDGTIGVGERILYDLPRVKLSDWVIPKDVSFYKQAPVMTAHSTFKGSDVGVKVSNISMKMPVNALASLMTGNTLTRGASKSALLSTPTTMTHNFVTAENFWRCVASFVFRRIYISDWAVAKKDVSAPNTNAEGYQKWLYNALVMFLFEYKSMTGSLRNVEWVGTTYDVNNNLFYLSADEVRECCTDEVVLADLEKFPTGNEVVLQAIEEARPYWVSEVKEFFDWCVDYTKFSYQRRAEVGYKGNMECWNAGFQQIRANIWDNTMEEKYAGLLNKARDYLRQGLDKFGFLQDTVEE